MEVYPTAGALGKAPTRCAVIPIIRGAGSVISKEGVETSIRRQAMALNITLAYDKNGADDAPLVSLDAWSN